MLSIFKSKLMLMIGIGGVVALIIWYGFLRSAPDASLLTTEELGQSTSAVDSDVVATLLTLRTVSLTGSIFQDPTFQRLMDFGSEIMPEPVGRPNPFAPISPVGGATSTRR